jgi:hypothetical protein
MDQNLRVSRVSAASLLLFRNNMETMKESIKEWLTEWGMPLAIWIAIFVALAYGGVIAWHVIQAIIVIIILACWIKKLIDWRMILLIATVGFLAYQHGEYIDKEIKWMTNHGYSDEAIRATIEEENPPQEDESDAP